MDEMDVRWRARSAHDAFRGESRRDGLDDRMRTLLADYAGIANAVCNGRYERGGYFRSAVGILDEFGADVSGTCMERCPSAELDVFQSARNAREDTLCLFHIAEGIPEGRDSLKIVDRADDIMLALSLEHCSVERGAAGLHSAVTAYIERESRAHETCESVCASTYTTSRINSTRIVFDRTPAVRDVPKRVIFSPPATIAFWGDGSKTIARCAEGEGFSEYVGLLVCIAKRHTKVPKHAMFEDVMAKLLRRAERQAPRARAKGVDAA